MIDRHRKVGWRKVKHKLCQACKIEEASEVHHIDARMDGGGDEEKNLIDLCWLCHQFAPNGHDEIKEYVKHRGFRGSIVNRAVILTLMKLAVWRDGFGGPTEFYKNVGISSAKDTEDFIDEIVDSYGYSFQEYFRVKKENEKYDIAQKLKTK